MKSGGRVHARLLGYDAGPWLEAQGFGIVSRVDASRDRRT
jgi:hypothetical protein